MAFIKNLFKVVIGFIVVVAAIIIGLGGMDGGILGLIGISLFLIILAIYMTNENFIPNIIDRFIKW